MTHSSSRPYTTAVLLEDERDVLRSATPTGTFATSRVDETALTSAALAPTSNQPRPLVGPGPVRRAAVVLGDLCAAVSIVFCIPLVILGIGIPIALCVRLLLWVGGLL
jgi:hypothetical protein